MGAEPADSPLKTEAHLMLPGDSELRATNVKFFHNPPRGRFDQTGTIVLLAQMGEKNHVQPWPEKLAKQTGTGLVRQVTMVAADTFLEMPGIGPISQHLLVVIGLQDQHATLLQSVGHQTGRNPQIRGNADFAIVRIDSEADRRRGIMGHGETAYLNIAKVDRLTCLEFDVFIDTPQTGYGSQSCAMSEDGQPVAPGHDAEPPAVILMLVGHENGVEIIGLDVDSRKSQSEFTAGQPCIDQNTALPAFNIEGIALAAAG